MIIRKVALDNKSDLEFVEKLYIESFPSNERRPVLEMHHLMEGNDKFNICILTEEDGNRIGFINYWIFDTFIFLEHFAISPEYRSGGYGKKALETLINETVLPLIAEIELPTSSEFAARRLKFYERLNFIAWDFAYEQPPYEDGFDAIPMILLSYRDIDLNEEFENVRNQIYREVYMKI